MSNGPLLEAFAAWAQEEGAAQSVRATPAMLRVKAEWAREEARQRRQRALERATLGAAGLAAILLGLTLPAQQSALLGVGMLLPCLAVVALLGAAFGCLMAS